MTLTLVLGGARSGKSRYAQGAAEALARERGVVPTFIATGEAGDAEMAERIARHRADRGGGWRTVEAPLALAEAVAELTAEDVAVVDCLTLWLANSMAQADGHTERVEFLPRALAASPARLWVISNEVGWGIVPDNPLARRFRDEAGMLHQRVATLAAETLLMVAGQLLRLERPAG
ncbi:MAG TPA: bifunctional adenosylcobinamide kinase/adenosylcobinamide-phosphate guanylyltransferase [Caulobacteraceae bacterium]|nr:bifunctional adenosylcobinamide kinase/adenosylcobinamide-phosphate guanylyltransferase [Caulobacteraceae bacterium]